MKKILLFMLLFFPISVFANSIVLDMDNNRVLNQTNMNEKKLIASTTKIMTAILAIESNKLEEIVTIGNEVLEMYGSNIYIEKNESILLLDLVYGLMLRSGNDAAISIATFVGQTENNFVAIMNKKAKELGMTNTIFYNPHGLDEETKNYSTAYDLAILYSYAYKNKIFKEITKTISFQTESNLKTYYWQNRNELLSNYKYATGGKTGYTPLAGRILVTSASKDNMNICIVTFDNNSYLYDYHQKTYEKTFATYKKYLVLDKDQFKVEDSNVYLNKSYYITLTEKEFNNIKIDIIKNKKQKNNIYGKVLVYLDEEIIYYDNVYIKQEKISFLDKLKYFLTNLLVFKN